MTVIRPVVTYRAETWVINKSDEKTLMTFEKKILKKIFGSVQEGNQWRKKNERLT
jgi:ATP-dependent Clp protease adapter protein ClpS